MASKYDCVKGRFRVRGSDLVVCLWARSDGGLQKFLRALRSTQQQGARPTDSVGLGLWALGQEVRATGVDVILIDV